MQVGFNPYRQNNKQNFCALSAAEIAKHTKSLHDVTNFKSAIVRGAIKLDEVDIANLKALATSLESQGGKFVAFVINKIPGIK